jgi:hypothetical protein
MNALKTILLVMALNMMPVPDAYAACDITVRFHNSSAEDLAFLPEWARTRTRLGTWRKMWPDEPAVSIASGQSYDRVFRARQCAWTIMRRFEFHIERDACRGEVTTVTTNVYAGGVRRRRDQGLPGADVLTVNTPNSGFLRMDSLNPADPDNADREGFSGEGLQLLVQDLGAVCDRARGDG